MQGSRGPILYGRRSGSSTPEEPRRTVAFDVIEGDQPPAAAMEQRSPGGRLYSTILPVTMEHSGYSHNGRLTLLEDMDFQLRDAPHPLVTRRIKHINPVEAENMARGPNKFSTSFTAGVGAGEGYAVDPTAPRHVTGRLEPSGFTTNNLSWVETQTLPDEEEERQRLGTKLHKSELSGTSKVSNMKNSFKPLPLHVDQGPRMEAMHSTRNTRPLDPMDLNYHQAQATGSPKSVSFSIVF
eukprot:TRINITY_DN878_c0_g1_i1.p1 TRINITY_DN878_c0_g1~~TRINITY_DN878_c0_g1_i1.p1  ORF type:complete len:239 (-),score=35.88 TRINITY_DN878_c0_g1_i1:237-953(-)